MRPSSVGFLNGNHPQAGHSGRRRQIRRVLRLQRLGQTRFARQWRYRQYRGHGHLPQLHARRPLRFIAEDPADQLLHLRLRLLREPGLQQRGPRAFQRGRGGHAHPGLLQAQLHRGPVPVQRHHPQCGLHHGADGGSGPAAARRTPLRRLHPPQDHSRGLAGTAGQCRALCRSPVHQRGTADRSRPERLGTGEDGAFDPWRDGRTALAHRGSQGSSQGPAVVAPTASRSARPRPPVSHRPGRAPR